MGVEWNVDHFVIDAATLARFRKTYEGFDAEVLKMENWYLANPNKSRRRKNHQRFIVNWLNANEKKIKKVPQNMKKQTEEFNEKFKQAVEEAAPPPSEWREMMNKLKRGL